MINLNLGIDYNGNKGFRLLSIYERLNKGEAIEKAQLAESFGVTQKTIQRDIDDLRAYLVETHMAENEVAIKYDKVRNVYYLVRLEREWLTNEEVLAVCKILLESRAFEKGELQSMIDKLIMQVVPSDRKTVENIIRNEYINYIPLKHGKKILSPIWEISQYINRQELISFNYVRKDGVATEHSVKPVAIMFSEYYFYLIAYLADDSKDYPTVFRIDRVSSIKSVNRKFTMPYSKRFNDGEFRKRVQFMYSGELRKVTFKYSGPSIESVLDKLPTAEVLSERDGNYIIRVEVYGSGIDMWLKSQGDKVEILTNNT